MRRTRTNGNGQPGKPRPAWTVFVVLAAILCNQQMVNTAGKAAAPRAMGPAGEMTVFMKEIPAWEVVDERARTAFLRGSYCQVQEQKQGGCTYPDLKSATPLYGQAHFPGLAGEAGEVPVPLLVLDQSEGKANTYDLLYLDANGDENLTNDPPHRARQDLPEVLTRKDSYLKEQNWFEPIKLSFDFGPAGARAVEMMPRLQVREDGYKMLTFVPTAVRSGTFETDGTMYRAFLGYQHHMVTGRLDQPGTALVLAPEGGAAGNWWGANELRAMHRLGGRYYRFSCTPLGDQLTVRPYDGKLGVLEVGAGGRNVEKLEMDGSLYSRETAVAVGDTVGREWPEPTRRCEIPVGDYYPAILHIRFNTIRLAVSNNYYSGPGGQSPSQPVAGITIRKDKPYVLDFSNKPAVVFTQPNDGGQVRPGEEVRIEALLIDPVLDIMIRDLDDLANVRKETYKDRNGKELTFERPQSLAPKVFVKRTDGEIVGEGVMPFG